MTKQSHNPWKKQASRLCYDNPWIRVEEDRVIKPSGHPGIYGLVKFKNIAVGIVPVDERGYTWLIGQYRYALSAYSWEIPMGGVPLDEDPLAGAQRELKEETGLSAGKWQKLMDLHTSNSVTDEVGVVYLAQHLTTGEAAPEDTEVLTLRHLPLGEAVEMAMDGRITDAISVAALLKLAVRPEFIAGN